LDAGQAADQRHHPRAVEVGAADRGGIGPIHVTADGIDLQPCDSTAAGRKARQKRPIGRATLDGRSVSLIDVVIDHVVSHVRRRRGQTGHLQLDLAAGRWPDLGRGGGIRPIHKPRKVLRVDARYAEAQAVDVHGRRRSAARGVVRQRQPGVGGHQVGPTPGRQLGHVHRHLARRSAKGVHGVLGQREGADGNAESSHRQRQRLVAPEQSAGV